MKKKQIIITVVIAIVAFYFGYCVNSPAAKAGYASEVNTQLSDYKKLKETDDTLLQIEGQQVDASGKMSVAAIGGNISDVETYTIQMKANNASMSGVISERKDILSKLGY